MRKLKSENTCRNEDRNTESKGVCRTSIGNLMVGQLSDKVWLWNKERKQGQTGPQENYNVNWLIKLNELKKDDIWELRVKNDCKLQVGEHR